MEGEGLTPDKSRSQSHESNSGSPDITRMMTPTLSEEKSEDISLDFSKFETDTMLHSTYNPDRDIDRSPDPTCLQLQSPSPLDLSITTSFENSLSDCGVASCFDSESSAKSSYPFSNNVSSTESDNFVHNLDEVLPIDTLSKTQVESVVTTHVNTVTAQPVILGSIGAANFVTAVLNKNRNMNQTPVLNNVIIPSTSIAMSTPSILVLNPCSLMNLMPTTSQPDSLHSASSLLSICPPPIKSILSLLNSKPEEIPREHLNLTSMSSSEPQIISLNPTEVTSSVVEAQAVCESAQSVVVIPGGTDDSELKPEQLSPVNLCTASGSLSRSNIVDISDIRDDVDDDVDDDFDNIPQGNQADEVDGELDESEMNDVTHDKSNSVNLQTDIQAEEPTKPEKPTDQNNKTTDTEPQVAVSDSNIVSKKRKQYGNRQKRVKSKDIVPYKCDLCSATFTISGNYLRHRKIHTICTEAEDPRFTCSECGRKFLQKCDLKRHMLIHTNQEPFRCTECDKGYIRKSDLKVHMRFHTKERSHPCDKCDKKFFQSGDLNRHKRHVHNEASSLKCGHCRKAYATEATLIRHMQSNHRELILKSLNEKLTENSSDEMPGVVVSRLETVSTEKEKSS